MKKEYSQRQINDSWERGLTVKGFDPDKFRMDFSENRMRKDCFGKPYHELGWRISDKDGVTPLNFKTHE